MAIVRAAEKHYLDLDNAVEVEDKLTRALNAVAAHSDRLKEKKEGGAFMQSPEGTSIISFDAEE